MLVVGLIVGPVIGLALGRVVASSQVLRGRARGVAAVVLVLVIAIVPVGDIGLRLGLDAGMVLGALLWDTPLPSSATGVSLPPGSPPSRAPEPMEAAEL
jgi:hypothetical protein